MNETFKDERQVVKEKFDQLVEMIISDPSFWYEVDSIDVFDRQSMTGAGSETIFMINVETNNRAQLLGQIYPFELGGYGGYFNNLYAGRIVEELENEIDPDYPFQIEVNAIPTETNSENYVDRHISREEAIRENILPSNSPLAKKMEKYNLSKLVLAGGTLITGPLYGSIESIEYICNEYDINSMLELFCGSAAHSKIALEHGAEHVECLDVNIGAAKENLEECADRVEFHEMDAFEFKPPREFDLILADPYFELINDFINQRVPVLTPHCRYFFTSIAFSKNTYWEEKVTNLLDEHLEEMEKIDTGRLIQVFGSPKEEDLKTPP